MPQGVFDRCPGTGKPPARITRRMRRLHKGDFPRNIGKYTRGICATCGRETAVRKGKVGQHRALKEAK